MTDESRMERYRRLVKEKWRGQGEGIDDPLWGPPTAEELEALKNLKNTTDTSPVAKETPK